MTNPGTADNIPIPYATDSLHPPLTPTQRTRMITFMQEVTVLPGIFGGAQLPKGDLHTASDTQLIADYAGIVVALDTHKQLNAPVTGPPNPLPSVAAFLALLTEPQTWLRVLEVLIGLVLLGIGVAHISGGAGATLRKIPVYGKAIPK